MFNCTPAGSASGGSIGSTCTIFSCGDRIGLTLVAQSACLSCISVVGLLSYVLYLVFRNRRTPGWRFFRSHLDLYLLGLLLSDLIQSIGGIMDIRWIHLSGVHEGRFCTAQGVLEQLGDVGVALCSLAIAVHTFAELFLRWKEPPTFTLPLIVLGLYATFLALIVGVGYAVNNNKKNNTAYYGDTTYWCWIRKDFIAEGIGLEYLWLWIAALVNVVLYIPLFLALKRIIVVVKPTETWLGWSVRRSTPQEQEAPSREQEEATVNARLMLYYPAVYIVTVLPIAVARIHAFVPHQHTPGAATFFSGMLFSASGFFNVLVYTSTRPALLRPSADPADPAMTPRHPKVFFLSDPSDTGVDNDTPRRSGDPTPSNLRMADSTFEMEDVPPRHQGARANTIDDGPGAFHAQPDTSS